MRSPRLYHLGGVVLDLVYRIDDLPPPGGERLAEDFLPCAGGAFHVLAAAAAQGLPGCTAGRHGRGPFGDLVRLALDGIGVERLLPITEDIDTGTCVVLVSRDGERTFVGRPGAEGRLERADLETIRPRSDDLCVLSGYTASFPCCRDAVDAWVDTLDDATPLVFDPSPLVDHIPDALREKILSRSDWLSANTREAALVAGTDTQSRAPEAADASMRTLIDRVTKRCPRAQGVIVRDGANGCHLALRDGDRRYFPGHPVDAVDTSGAGDVHVGTFVARLAQGDEPFEACRIANAAAAVWVTCPSGAAAPAPGAVAALLDRA